MSKKHIVSLFCCFIIFSIKAQNEQLKEQSPINEPRFQYFKNTVLLYNEYLQTNLGSVNTTNFRFSTPIGNKSWNLRTDVPLVSANTSQKNKSGLGDISASLTHLFYLKENNGIGIKVKIISNSASDSNFGSGKWIFSPSFIYGHYFFDKKLQWLSFAEYKWSITGSSNKNKTSTAILENNFSYKMNKNWITAGLVFRYKKITDGFDNNIFIEFGRKLTPSALLYLHPSYGFGQQKSFNTGLELGTTLVF